MLTGDRGVGGSRLGEALFLLEEAERIGHVGSWVTLLDAPGEVIWSKQCYAIFGLAEGTHVTLEDYHAMVHEDDRARVHAARVAAIEEGAPYDIEYRVLRPDGDVRWVRARAALTRAADGTALRLAGVFRDITEDKRVLDALRESEARYRTIVETSNEGIWMIGFDGRTTFVNARMAAILRATPAELLGRPAIDFVTPGCEECLSEALRLRERGKARQLEIALRNTRGEQVWTLAEVTPVYDFAGTHRGALAMVTDITERRRAEDALRASEARFASSEEQLRQAQKMEAIGRLAGGVAHDFNNLLSVIISYTSFSIEDLPEADPMRTDLEQVRKASLRAADLTRHLLAFSRRQVLEPRVLDLNDTLLGMEKMVRRLVGEDVQLTLRLAPGIGKLHADPSQIEQVIMNLVVNARDAMPRGGALVLETGAVELDEAYAACHSGVRPGPHVRLSVTDTGTGMDAAIKARIFEPFFTTKEKDRGTGLGLSTVLGIVQQSGGHVTVWSEPGKGARFEIFLPRRDAELDAGAVVAAPPAVTLRGTETVLLVEDEEQVRALAATILRRNGYAVIEAANAGEALLIAEDHSEHLDLVLTDVVMPRMSGPQVAERIQKERPGIPVLFMSGYPGEALAPHGVLDSGVVLLQKPIRPDPLLRKVREVLDQPR